MSKNHEDDKYIMTDLTGPQFMDRLVRQGSFGDESTIQKKLENIEIFLEKVLPKNSRNQWREIKQWYLSYRRSLRITPADYDSDYSILAPEPEQIFLYRLYSIVRLNELVSNIINRISPQDQSLFPASMSELSSLVSPAFRDQLSRESLPEFAHIFGSSLHLNLIDFLIKLGNFCKNKPQGKVEVDQPTFIALAELLGYLVLSENPDDKLKRYDLLKLFALVPNAIEFYFNVDFGHLEKTGQARSMITLLSEFGTQSILVLVDPDDPRHEAAKLFWDILQNQYPDSAGLVAVGLAEAIFDRDIKEGTLDHMDWLRSLKELGEEDDWFKKLFDQLMEKLDSEYSQRLYWVSELDSLVSKPLEASFAPSQAALQASLESWLQRAPTNINERLQTANLTPAINGYQQVHMRLQIKSNLVVGTFRFIPDSFPSQNENQRKTKFLHFSINLDTPEFQVDWNLIDEESLSPELEASLWQLISLVIAAHLATYELSDDEVATSLSDVDVPQLLSNIAQLPSTEIWTAPPKGPQWQAPKATKRQPKTPEAEEDGYVTHQREIQLKPQFICDQKIIDKLKDKNFSPEDIKLITRKLENQKRGTSRIKQYPYEVEPNPKEPVYAMRVDRYIRILAQRPSENTSKQNIMIVYKIVRKDKHNSMARL